MTQIQSFNESTISRHFSKDDFFNDPNLSNDFYRAKIVKGAVFESEELFPNGIDYHRFSKNRSLSYSVSNLEQRLVLRTCAAHINRAYKKQNKSRSQIAREMRAFLADGTPYNIFRLDIASFFENIKKDELIEKIDRLKGLSMQSKKLIKRKIDIFQKFEGVCVPRGLETSSILSDLYLKDFDKFIVESSDVFFYSRFVDDILIVSSPELPVANFKDRISNYLPDGLKFNGNKTEIHEVPKRNKSGDAAKGKIVAQFNYLGFKVDVIDTPLPIKADGKENKNTSSSIFRQVKIDLSPKKVKRVKDKICKAFYAYGKNQDYDLLRDRIRFLTSNRELVKKQNSTIIPVGVYYNSSACDLPSDQLSHLDGFMRYLLFSSTDRLMRTCSRYLSSDQRRELAKFSFVYGFDNRVHKRFSYDRLSRIVKVWK